mgnify:FL=1
MCLFTLICWFLICIDHDDRASGSSNIRKVSFMNGVGGRVKKNRHKFPNNAMLDDGDVNMGGNERKQWNKLVESFVTNM